MKSILIVILSVIFLISCSNTISKQQLAIDGSKEIMIKRGGQFIKLDTVITTGILNSKDSCVDVIFKGKNENYNGYFVTQSIISNDTIKQSLLLASGTKEHCISYVYNRVCMCESCVDLRRFINKEDEHIH